MNNDLTIIIAALSHVGLDYRGGFHPRSEDLVPDIPDIKPRQPGTLARQTVPTGTLLLVGNIGGSMWPAFEAGRRDETDALDKWTKRILSPVISQLEKAHGSIKALYPSDGPPYHPFQRWAMRGEPVYPSPIGILIHPDHGLWHAYRGALLFSKTLDLPTTLTQPSPCDSCSNKPCLAGCPVQAIGQGFYDVETCAAHLSGPSGKPCHEFGCLARSACPVGPRRPYPEAQTRFHMGIFRDTYGTP